jgi:hypothetical protein
MRKIFTFALLIFVTVSVSSAKEKSVESVWASSPLKIDGLADDWENDPLFVEKKVKAEYAFRNDSDILYVYFKFNDAQFLSSIETTGMTLWIDSKGKKNKNLGVKFTKKQISADEFIAVMEKQKGTLSDEQKEDLRASEFYFVSQTEAVNKKGDPVEHGEGGEAVKAAAFNVSIQKDTVAYEFRVPLKNLIEATSESDAGLGEILGIGFEWGGLTDEMRKAYMKGDASGGTGRMGISEGGRGGGGGQSVGFDGAAPASLTALRQMTKKHSFWTAVRMAKDDSK